MVVNFAAGLVHIKAKINGGGGPCHFSSLFSAPAARSYSHSVCLFSAQCYYYPFCFLFDQHMLSTPITKTMQKSSGVELLLLLYLPPTHH